MKKMNKKGFTLVEIMIVVAIIGLLAAIGIPSFNKARATAMTRSKESNVRLLIAAAQQYAIENVNNPDLDTTSIPVTSLEEFIDGGLDKLIVGGKSIDAETLNLDDQETITVESVYEE